MNNTPYWACAALCLTCMVPPFAASAEDLGQQLSSAFYSEDVDCSGLAGPVPMESVADVPPRLPYGFRWDDYQGADIEHDVYGDRQRAFKARSCPHVPLGPAVARRFSGLFATPGPRANVLRPAPTTEQGSDQPADCGCETHQASPLAPVPFPVPPDTDPAIPDEPAPAEPSVVPPRNIVPQRRSPPSIPQAVPSPGLKQSRASRPETTPAKLAAPLSQPKVKRTTISMRLIPIQILPAAVPLGVSTAKAQPADKNPAPVVRGNEPRRNKIPATISTQDSAVGETGKGAFTDFFYELLLGSRK